MASPSCPSSNDASHASRPGSRLRSGPLARPALAQDDREIPREARKQYAAALQEAAALVGSKQFDSASEKLEALLATTAARAAGALPQGRRRDRAGPDRRRDGGVPRADRGLPGAARTLQQSRRPSRAARRIRGRAAWRSRLRFAPRPEWSVAHENLGDIYARLAAVEYAQAAKFDKANKTAPAKLALVRDLLASAASAKPKT